MFFYASAFKDTDFFIVPGDFGWTMIHTHEDYELGGPYFIRKDWIRSRSMGLHHDARHHYVTAGPAVPARLEQLELVCARSSSAA